MASRSQYYAKKILLVAENSHTLDLYCEGLEDHGFEITKAISGESAMKELESKHFDLIVTDFNMDQVNGISILKRAKALDPKTMVIITRENTDVNYAIEACCLHVNDYILKPFNINYLLTSFDKYDQFSDRDLHSIPRKESSVL